MDSSAGRGADSVHAVWRSPAKVNLCLRIVGRRADGLHLLDSVFVPVGLYDRIEMVAEDVGPGRPADITLSCAFPGVPGGSENLVVRAAASLLEEAGLGGRVRLRLHKRIPPGAGLGGGSGNAAAVLMGMSRALELDLPRARLGALALTLGADVPFFLDGRPARVRGIGERVEPIPDWPARPLIVAIPPVAVSTAWAFRAFAASAEVRTAHRQPAPERAATDEAARLAAGVAPTAALLVNDLEPVVFAAFPEVGRVKAELRAAGAAAAVMSGSGSAVVGVAETGGDARVVAAALASRLPAVRVHVVELAPPGP